MTHFYSIWIFQKWKNQQTTNHPKIQPQYICSTNDQHNKHLCFVIKDGDSKRRRIIGEPSTTVFTFIFDVMCVCVWVLDRLSVNFWERLFGPFVVCDVSYFYWHCAYIFSCGSSDGNNSVFYLLCVPL